MALEKRLIGDCKEKENATDDDVKTVMDRTLPTTPTGKCLLACVHETVGVVRINIDELLWRDPLKIKPFFLCR